MREYTSAMLSRVAVAGMLLGAFTGSVAQAAVGPGTVGAEYLTLPIGSKSIAMGEVQSAAIGEPLGWLSNPATLRCMDGLGFGVFHAEWLMETQYDNVAYHQRINNYVSVAAGFVSLRRPEIQGYDDYGRKTRVLDNANYQAMMCLGYSPVPSLAAGLTVKYFNEKLDDLSAGGVGFDIGALYTITSARLSLCFVAQNVGQDITFESVKEPLPTTLRGGASFSADIHGGDATVTIASDLVKPRYEKLYASAGADLTVLKTISARVGYNGEQYRSGNGLTLGCGAAIRNISFDYAWTSYGDLGSVHRVALYFMLH
jgi:hypothetical protein